MFPPGRASHRWPEKAPAIDLLRFHQFFNERLSFYLPSVQNLCDRRAKKFGSGGPLQSGGFGQLT